MFFFLVATPIGFSRRIGGADATRSTNWNDESVTAFVERNYEFVGKDLETPY